MKNKNRFFLNKTKYSLKDLGLVALIISLSVMFSSLCIMSLISLSDSLYDAMQGNPKSQLGGEVKISVPFEIADSIEEKLDNLSQDDSVKEYTSLGAIYRQYVLYLSKTYGKEYISILGYEDDKYPLDNVMTLASGNENMSYLLNDQNGIVISEILAERNNIKIGDEVTLVSSDFFKKENFKVVDFIEKDFQGNTSSVFINTDRLRSFEDITAKIFYADGDQEKISKEILSLDNESVTVLELDSYTEDQIENDRSLLLFIRGLSVLGLFIGSFGIASAIKVIINKRRKELGILKVIGFVGKDVSTMLLLEVSVISILGSLFGVIFGYIFFYYLVNILSSADSINIIINTKFNLLASVISFFVSIVASILFAYISIKPFSEIKPIYALKNIGYIQTNKEKGKNIVRFVLIALIFVGISIVLAQSVIYGIGAVAIVSIGILLFSLIFRLIYFLILKIPIRTHNFIELAWNNLRINYKKIIVSMVAIFAGIVAINLINTLMYSSQKVYSDRYQEITIDTNIVTDRANPSDNKVDEVLYSLDEVKEYTSFYKKEVEYKDDTLYGELVGIDLVDVENFYNILDGELTENGVLISSMEAEYGGYSIGDTIEIDDIKISITGIYEINYGRSYNSIANLNAANIVSKDHFKRNFASNFIEEVWISTDDQNIDFVLDKLSDIRDVFITTSKQFENMLNSSINLLIKFTTSVASLALLAGIILIITVTVLDVVSRRRDFAIYKVIGFDSKKIMGMVLIEYTLMTVITSVFASGLVYLFTIFMNNYGEDIFDVSEKIYFDLKGGILWNMGLIILVSVLVFLVARKTLKVKPSEMLRYE
jgi:ABC-type antimicrobial peptide transport system permease subunit